MNKYKLAMVAAILVTLSACGDNTKDRALSGAGVGAGVGAIGSAITGGNPITGAVVGGAVGAGVGAATDKDDVNLGKPTWRK